MTPTIIYEDQHLIAVNKPIGVVVQSDKKKNTLAEQLQQFLQNRDGGKEPFIAVAHRIDQPISGVIILAKTKGALRHLNTLFSERKVQKKYWAVVAKLPEPTEGTLTHYVRKQYPKNRSQAFLEEKKGSKKAVLHYRHLNSSDRYHLLEIELETGRHHQIRVQLGKIGSAVKGDIKYGSKRTNKGGGIHLHARQLILPHPIMTKKELCLEAMPPDDVVWNVLTKSGE